MSDQRKPTWNWGTLHDLDCFKTRNARIAMGQELGPLVNPKMADVYGHVCSCSLPPYGAPLHGQCFWIRWDEFCHRMPQVLPISRALYKSWAKHHWLVVWLPFFNIFYFPINIGNVIIPIDELIFFRGVALAHQPDHLQMATLDASRWCLAAKSPISWTCPDTLLLMYPQF